MSVTHERFRTAEAGGLDWSHAAMHLWRRAKKLGVWDPESLDFGPDREHYALLEEPEQEILLHLAALFGAGEEAVTLDILPLLRTMADEGRLEEEIYLTSFLWEEAKHTELFRRIEDVMEAKEDLHRFHGPAYRRIFYQALPGAMARLDSDRSPVAVAEAAATYNMIVEGVLAQTGYHAWGEMLRRRGILPATQEGLRLVQQDEARHIAYGIFLLSRLVAEHGDPVWEAIETRMGALLGDATELIQEIFAVYLERYGEIPFGLDLDDFLGYAMTHFQRRMDRIEQVRGRRLEEIVHPKPGWDAD